MAGPQGRDPRRGSARGHMIMCGESAARASRVPSPVQACTGRRVAVVGACRGVAPFEFRVYTLVALYSRFNAHRDLLRQRRRGKLHLLSHAFASEHAPVVACCTRLPRDPVLEVVGGRYGPGGVLFAVWPLCALASALSAVAAVAHALVLSVTAVSPRSGVRIRWPVDYMYRHLEFAEQVTDPCGHSSCPRAPLLNSLKKWQLSERGGYAW